MNIRELERALNAWYGNLGWWPAENEDEIIISAILTQNTTWKNALRALENLRQHGLNSLHTMIGANREQLKEYIRPAGFHNLKTEYIIGVAAEIVKRGGIISFQNVNDQDAEKFFLSLKGVGNETMEDILLYALNRKKFVWDKYAIRLFNRIGFEESFENIEFFIEKNFSLEQIKNLHGCIVELSKEFCRAKPECKGCPVREGCQYYENVFTEP